MSVREIVLWPDPGLEMKCAPVSHGDDVRVLAEDLLETMYAASGRGLAAPQVGVLRRVFVMDVTWKDGVRDPMVFLNPEVLSASDRMSEGDEGCLSIPGITARVRRPDEVCLRWMNLDGSVREDRFDGFAARCVQHEVDHLDGIVTLNRIAPDTRAALEAEYMA
ncbi:peptide deformylase [Thalassococcus sp. S3]|uniref:peptide deformylase n=1 Tax=Thalassococcus sp. S3 TaxID=2017482 RepID=UPI0010245686|nr:peptide deformylase [Thalassococcus sp. S3]QBF29995.1 peptide deformylase [Thalassococcus sp. S3]